MPAEHGEPQEGAEEPEERSRVLGVEELEPGMHVWTSVQSEAGVEQRGGIREAIVIGRRTQRHVLLMLPSDARDVDPIELETSAGRKINVVYRWWPL